MTDKEALDYFYGQMERGNIENGTMQIAYERAIEALETKMMVAAMQESSLEKSEQEEER